MKKYAVFVKKHPQAFTKVEGETSVIWHFLNDTDDFNEAYRWAIVAENQEEKYKDVQIVQAVFGELQKVYE